MKIIIYRVATSLLLLPVMLAGCSSKLEVVKISENYSGPMPGIPFHLMEPRAVVTPKHQDLLSHVAATDDNKKPKALEFDVKLIYDQPDPNHRYTINVDPKILSKVKLDVTLDTQGQLTKMDETVSTSVPAAVKSLSAFASLVFPPTTALAAAAEVSEFADTAKLDPVKGIRRVGKEIYCGTDNLNNGTDPSCTGLTLPDGIDKWSDEEMKLWLANSEIIELYEMKAKEFSKEFFIEDGAMELFTDIRNTLIERIKESKKTANGKTLEALCKDPAKPDKDACGLIKAFWKTPSSMKIAAFLKPPEKDKYKAFKDKLDSNVVPKIIAAGILSDWVEINDDFRWYRIKKIDVRIETLRLCKGLLVSGIDLARKRACYNLQDQAAINIEIKSLQVTQARIMGLEAALKRQDDLSKKLNLLSVTPAAGGTSKQGVPVLRLMREEIEAIGKQFQSRRLALKPKTKTKKEASYGVGPAKVAYVKWDATAGKYFCSAKGKKKDAPSYVVLIETTREPDASNKISDMFTKSWCEK